MNDHRDKIGVINSLNIYMGGHNFPVDPIYKLEKSRSGFYKSEVYFQYVQLVKGHRYVSMLFCDHSIVITNSWFHNRLKINPPMV